MADNQNLSWQEPRPWQIASDATSFTFYSYAAGIYKDDGALNSATTYTSNTIKTNSTFRLRFEVANLGTSGGNITRRLEFQENGGAWTQLTTNSNNVRLIDSTYFTDGAATTSKLPPHGTFIAGQGKDTGSDTSPLSLNANYYTEDEYALSFQDAASGNSYAFRITDAGTALTAAYGNTTIAAMTGQYIGGTGDGWSASGTND